MVRATACLVIALSALPGRGASGRGPQPPVWLRTFPPALKITTSLHSIGGTFNITSPQLGSLYAGSGSPLFNLVSPCEVTAEVRAAPRGFDVAYTVSNPTAAALAAPSFVVGGFPLTEPVEYLDHGFGCTWSATSPQPGGAVITPSLTYPSPGYSPVMVLRDSDVAIGLSLQYPVVQYKQSVTPFATGWGGTSNWLVYFHLGGEIPAGASREYVLSARFAQPADWIHTLQPYRDYFWSMYGNKPAYTQDLRPVYADHMASSTFFAPDNPRGFIPSRPDLVGWKDLVTDLLSVAVKQKGYRRLMLWSPSGLYQTSFWNNYPAQYMTEWSPAMSNTAGELQRLTRAGVQVCFWWGHSAAVADGWEDPAYEIFDPDNPAHVQAMMAEWELAVTRGASGAGLDGFEALPLETALPWLEKMRSMKPDAFFTAEAACCDIMHLRAPFWLQSVQLPTPHLLSDYLVPGRETWVHLVGPEINLTRAAEVISWGNTVCWVAPPFTAPQLKPIIAAALHESTVQAGPAARRQRGGPRTPGFGSRNRRPR